MGNWLVCHSSPTIFLICLFLVFLHIKANLNLDILHNQQAFNWALQYFVLY
jgi:hypothetical protein